MKEIIPFAQIQLHRVTEVASDISGQAKEHFDALMTTKTLSRVLGGFALVSAADHFSKRNLVRGTAYVGIGMFYTNQTRQNNLNPVDLGNPLSDHPQ